MRAADSPDAPVIWDYHVILLRRNDAWEIWDPDSTLGCPVAAAEYIRHSFRPAAPAAFQPRFRVVAAETYVDRFASDRRHMRAGGRWLAEPPPWPPIGVGWNLGRFIDMTRPFVGEVLDLTQLSARFVGTV